MGQRTASLAFKCVGEDKAYSIKVKTCVESDKLKEIAGNEKTFIFMTTGVGDKEKPLVQMDEASGVHAAL